MTAGALAQKVGSVARARTVLKRAKAKGKALGGLGKASRTLTYTLK